MIGMHRAACGSAVRGAIPIAARRPLLSSLDLHGAGLGLLPELGYQDGVAQLAPEGGLVATLSLPLARADAA